jgi:hypothetical protein
MAHDDIQILRRKCEEKKSNLCKAETIFSALKRKKKTINKIEEKLSTLSESEDLSSLEGDINKLN